MSAPTVVMWAGVISFPLISIVALLSGGSATTGDLWLGGGAGAVGALGLVALFAGLGRGHAAAVAPAAAAVGGVVPVAYAVAGGESLSTLTWLGVAVALPAIVLCSWVRDPAEVPFGGLWYGILAGVGFGAYAVLIDRTSQTSGLLPLIPARAATMLTVVVVGLVGIWRITERRHVPRLVVAGNGVLDVSGNVALLLALRVGSLAPVAIAASFYPAVTVLLARTFNHEPIRVHQMAGLALTVMALAAMAAG